MAELGSINFRDVNAGTTREDRSQEAQAIDNILRTGKTIVDESITRSVTGDMQEAIESAAMDGEDILSPVPEQSGTDPVVYPEGSREAHLSNTLGKLTRVMEQGNGSQRALAEMRVKKVLNEAQDKYPWLYEDLQARAGAILSGSARLEELAMEDAARVSSSSDASAQVKAITDHARRKWADGGLGIDPALGVKDPRFIAQYSERQAMRDTAERAARVAGMSVANAELDASMVSEEFTAMLSGYHSNGRQQLMQAFDDHGITAALTEISKGDQGDLGIISQAQNVGIPAAIAELEILKINASEMFEGLVTPKLAGTTHFAPLKTRQEDFIEQVDSMITRLSDMQNQIPDAPSLIKEMQAIRAYDFGSQMDAPFRSFMAYVASPEGEALTRLAYNAKSGDGLVLKHTLETAGASALGQMYSMYDGSPTPDERNTLNYLSSGSFQVTPDMAAGDINRAMARRFRESEFPYQVPVRGTDQRLDANTKIFTNWEDTYSRMENIPENAGPAVAGDFLTGLNFALVGYNGEDRKPSDVQNMVLDGLASPSITRAIDAVGDTDQRNHRLAFGEAAKEYYISTNPLRRRQEMLQTYEQTHIDDVALNELVSVNVDRMSTDGEFVYDIDERAVKKAAERRQATHALSKAPSVGLARHEAAVRSEIMSIMDPIAAEVMQQINIEQNLMRANAPSVDKRTRSEINLEFYAGANDPGNPLPFSEIFRHTGTDVE